MKHTSGFLLPVLEVPRRMDSRMFYKGSQLVYQSLVNYKELQKSNKVINKTGKGKNKTFIHCLSGPNTLSPETRDGTFHRE